MVNDAAACVWRGPAHCGSAFLRTAPSPLTEVRSILALPAPVRTLLARNEFNGAPEEIADAGRKFNPTDYGGGPHRRFGIAGLNADCAMVAVEQGGIGYHVRLFVFRRDNDQWSGGPAGYIGRVLPSLQQLRQAMAPRHAH
jgi:hypothetical protein